MTLAAKLRHAAAAPFRALRLILIPPPTTCPEQMRDWRMNLSLYALSGAGVAMTLLVGLLSRELAARGAIWPMLYVIIGLLIIIGIVVTTYAWVLGRTGLKLEVTRDGITAEDRAT